MFQACFHLLPLGRIKHQRNFDVRRQARRQLVHIFHAIAANEINVHIEDVRALAFLLAGQRYQAVPILGVEQVAHFFRAAGVYALADNQK